MSPRSVVVTGANSGIGLGLVLQLTLNKDIRHIIATVRDYRNAMDLEAIGDRRVHILLLEVTNERCVDQFVANVARIVGDDGLNLLINNAGTIVKYSTKTPPDRALLTHQLDVNTISVVLLTQKLIPLLAKAAAKVPGTALSVDRAAVVFISSGAGSIIDNTIGSGWFDGMAYRLSKTAINQFARTIAVDLKDDHILSVSFCPGRVKTKKANDESPLTVTESTKKLVESMRKLNNNHNGLFFENDLTLKNF